jgi:hypothetical protein
MVEYSLCEIYRPFLCCKSCRRQIRYDIKYSFSEILDDDDTEKNMNINDSTIMEEKKKKGKRLHKEVPSSVEDQKYNKLLI